MLAPPVLNVDCPAKAIKMQPSAYLNMIDYTSDPSCRFKRRLFLNSDIKDPLLRPSPASSAAPVDSDQMIRSSKFSEQGLTKSAESPSDGEDNSEIRNSYRDTEIVPIGYWTDSPCVSAPPSPFSPRSSAFSDSDDVKKEKDLNDKASLELGSLVESVRISTADEKPTTVRKHLPGILPALEQSKIPSIIVQHSAPIMDSVARYCSLQLAERAMFADMSRRTQSVKRPVSPNSKHSRLSTTPKDLKNQAESTRERAPVQEHPSLNVPADRSDSIYEFQAMPAQSSGKVPVTVSVPAWDGISSAVDSRSKRRGEYSRVRSAERLPVPVGGEHLHVSNSSSKRQAGPVPVQSVGRALPEKPTPAWQPSPSTDGSPRMSHPVKLERAHSAERTPADAPAPAPKLEYARLDAQVDDADLNRQVEPTHGPVRARSRSASSASAHPTLPLGLEHWINLGDGAFQCPRDGTVLRGQRSAMRHEEKDLNKRSVCEFCGAGLARRDAVLRHQKITCKKVPRADERGQLLS